MLQFIMDIQQSLPDWDFEDGYAKSILGVGEPNEWAAHLVIPSFDKKNILKLAEVVNRHRPLECDVCFPLHGHYVWVFTIHS